MAQRQRDWARRTRDSILELLGEKCKKCKQRYDLEFDCIIPVGNEHHRKMEWSHRMSFYRKQLAAGNLQILCSPCNSRKSDNVPF